MLFGWRWQLRRIRKWRDKSKWHVECWVWSHTHLWYIHEQVLESYINFVLIYTADHIFPVLPIKDLINEDGRSTTSFKFATETKPSVSHLCVLFCPWILQEATVYVGTKSLNMRHQAQKSIHGIFVGILQHQKVNPVYVPHKFKIASSYNFIFGDIFSSTLAYTSQPYSEVMAIIPAVSYIPYTTSSKVETGNIITVAYFKRGIYYRNLMTVWKLVTSMMIVQLFLHELVRPKLMKCHWLMNLMMNLCLRICYKTFMTEANLIRE